MKCPKCDYLGFETGDRCKNCGYDFSLAADTAPRDRDLPLREVESIHRDPDRWLNQLEARLDTVRPVATSSASSDPLGSMSLDASAAAPTVVPQPGPAPSPAAAPASVAPPLTERLDPDKVRRDAETLIASIQGALLATVPTSSPAEEATR